MKLLRSDFVSNGIFGLLLDEQDQHICFTLEHAYATPMEPSDPDYDKDHDLQQIKYVPKVPAGIYTCKRGMHQLEGMRETFETFEIQDVPGHTNILFHTGNSNSDSAGCVLLGLMRQRNYQILESRAAFKLFMDRLKHVDEFDLVVEDGK